MALEHIATYTTLAVIVVSAQRFTEFGLLGKELWILSWIIMGAAAGIIKGR